MWAKGHNFAISPQEIPIMDLKFPTESTIQYKYITQEEAEQFRIKVTTTVAYAKHPPPYITPQERKDVTSLSKDQDTILLTDKEICTMVLNTSDHNRTLIAKINYTFACEVCRWTKQAPTRNQLPTDIRKR